MLILRSMTGKSGGSVARFARKSAVLTSLVAFWAVSGCAGKGWPGLTMHLENTAGSAATAIDARVWQVGDARGFAGFVIADEPQAAGVGRDILAGGGNAADAATAVYFSLAVTYPGAAGLGGGGSCLYSGPEGASALQIGFPAGEAKAGGKVAVPGNIKGFAWLNAQHGRTAWDQLLAPAARLAGSGAVMSKATSAQVAANRSLRWPPEGMTSNGDTIALGRSYRQPGMAATLARLQGSGADGFYSGDLGRVFVEDARRSDSTITQDDLRNYKVTTGTARRVEAGGVNVFIRNGSAAENSVWKSAVDSSKPLDADMNSLRSGDAGSTSFVVADAEGRAVTCIVSMNGAFGFGDVSRTTGIYFSSAQDATSLSNMVMVTAPGRGLIYASASGGGASGLQKSAATLSEVVLMKISTLEAALRHNQNSGFDPVNAFSCPDGLTKDPKSCRFGTEPDSNGYALLAE